MFTFNPTTMAMSLSKGDTASFDITATGDVTFTNEDRAVFTVKDKKGAVVKETVATLDSDKTFRVYFLNADTEDLKVGTYQWDVRYVFGADFDSLGRVVNGDSVITPMTPKDFNLLATVGDI